MNASPSSTLSWAAKCPLMEVLYPSGPADFHPRWKPGIISPPSLIWRMTPIGTLNHSCLLSRAGWAGLQCLLAGRNVQPRSRQGWQGQWLRSRVSGVGWFGLMTGYPVRQKSTFKNRLADSGGWNNHDPYTMTIGSKAGVWSRLFIPDFLTPILCVLSPVQTSISRLLISISHFFVGMRAMGEIGKGEILDLSHWPWPVRAKDKW